MIKESQEILEKLFESEHIIGSPFYNKKTGNWHVKLKDGQKLREKDLLYIQQWIDFYNGEDVEWD